MAEFAVKGLKELGQFLDQLPAKLEANVVRGALRNGAKVIETTAKANAPVGQPNQENVRLYGGYAGALRDSIRTGSRIKGGKVTAYVRAGGKSSRTKADVFYAHMVEFGTKAHFIHAKQGGWLSFSNVFAKQISHPGTTKRPFMRPALDTQAEAALNAAAKYMKARLASRHGLDTAGVKLEGDE